MVLPKTLVRIFYTRFWLSNCFELLCVNFTDHFSAYEDGVIHNYATETTTLNEEVNHDKDDDSSWINKDYQKVTNL